MTSVRISGKAPFFREVLKSTHEFSEISNKLKELRDFMDKAASENLTEELKELSKLHPGALQTLDNVYVSITMVGGVLRTSSKVILRRLVDRDLLSDDIFERGVLIYSDVLYLDDIILRCGDIYNHISSKIYTSPELDKLLRAIFSRDPELFAAMWPFPGYKSLSFRNKGIGSSGSYKFFNNEEDLMTNFPEVYEMIVKTYNSVLPKMEILLQKYIDLYYTLINFEGDYSELYKEVMNDRVG